MSWTNPLVPRRADPHVTLHTDGYYYLAATAPEYDRIELRRARTLGGLAAAEPKVVWRKHETGPMGAHIWAPELHFIDGKWYVYFTAGEAENKWAIRPYVLEGEGSNPLEAKWTEKGRAGVQERPRGKSDPAASQFGPGHNCFTTTPDGKTDLLVYHSRSYEKITGDALSNPDRATRAQVIRWRADGSPDFGTPVADGPYQAPGR